MTFSCPDFIAKRKDTLAFQLFSYLSAIIITILLVQALAEKALIHSMLKVPSDVKQEMLNIADQANVLIDDGDMDELADWANAQKYYLFVLNTEQQPITDRTMHPHFEFKLRYLRDIHGLLNNRVSKPLLGIPLIGEHTLVIQLPAQLHPAHHFLVYLGISRLAIAIIILVLFSFLIARKLQQPLDRLREASRKLSQGDFNVNVQAELKSRTREFNELARDFDYMTKEIHSLAEKQRRLIRDVSHELRTPLARQNLVLHLLRSRASEAQLPLVDKLENEANELDHLVGEILEFSRLENSRYDAHLKPILPESVINVQLERSKADLQSGQSLSLGCITHSGMIMADERLLLRCMSNLIGNALKYAGEQAQVSVCVGSRVHKQREWHVITVSDNGPGISKEHLTDIFNPFSRLEMARDKQSGGYGIGLAIVKEAMRVMQGRVEASNREEGGLKVSLLFPVEHRSC